MKMMGRGCVRYSVDELRTRDRVWWREVNDERRCLAFLLDILRPFVRGELGSISIRESHSAFVSILLLGFGTSPDCTWTHGWMSICRDCSWERRHD